MERKSVPITNNIPDSTILWWLTVNESLISLIELVSNHMSLPNIHANGTTIPIISSKTIFMETAPQTTIAMNKYSSFEGM